jgi:hypothetical protein
MIKIAKIINTEHHWITGTIHFQISIYTILSYHSRSLPHAYLTSGLFSVWLKRDLISVKRDLTSAKRLVQKECN